MYFIPSFQKRKRFVKVRAVRLKTRVARLKARVQTTNNKTTS